MSLEGKMKVKELSTGMTAKLKVIATLSRKAELYLLDEPFNGIDYKAKKRSFGLTWKQRMSTIHFVISTHMIDRSRALSKKRRFIKDGEVDTADFSEEAEVGERQVGGSHLSGDHVKDWKRRRKRKRGNEMGRLIKYEFEKTADIQKYILALLLVFLLASAVGIFSDNREYGQNAY